jgi:hypothetical protein
MAWCLVKHRENLPLSSPFTNKKTLNNYELKQVERKKEPEIVKGKVVPVV